MKTIIFLMAILLLNVGLVSAHGETEIGYDDHHDDMMHGFYGIWNMGAFGWTFMILAIVALILFIVWTVRQLQSNEGKHEGRRRRK